MRTYLIIPWPYNGYSNKSEWQYLKDKNYCGQKLLRFEGCKKLILRHKLLRFLYFPYILRHKLSRFEYALMTFVSMICHVLGYFWHVFRYGMFWTILWHQLLRFTKVSCILRHKLLRFWAKTAIINVRNNLCRNNLWPQ